MHNNNNDDICLIEDDHDDIATENPPNPNKWQSFELSLEELDCATGVCWHPATAKKPHRLENPQLNKVCTPFAKKLPVGLSSLTVSSSRQRTKTPGWAEARSKKSYPRCWRNGFQMTIWLQIMQKSWPLRPYMAQRRIHGLHSGSTPAKHTQHRETHHRGCTATECGN